MDAKMAIIPMTTNNSMSVKPALLEENEERPEPNTPVLSGALPSPRASDWEWETLGRMDPFHYGPANIARKNRNQLGSLHDGEIEPESHVERKRDKSYLAGWRRVSTLLLL
jgi:hypothetical protein